MNRKIIVANIGIRTQAKITAHHLDFNRVSAPFGSRTLCEYHAVLKQRENHHTLEKVGLGLFSTLTLEMGMWVGIDVNHSAVVLHLSVSVNLDQWHVPASINMKIELVVIRTNVSPSTCQNPSAKRSESIVCN